MLAFEILIFDSLCNATIFERHLTFRTGQFLRTVVEKTAREFRGIIASQPRHLFSIGFPLACFLPHKLGECSMVRFSLPMRLARSIVLGISMPCLLVNIMTNNSHGQGAGQAQQPTSWSWESTKLSPLFFGEGGTICELDGDGNPDVVAGYNIYFGPTFDRAVPLVDAKPVSIIGYSKFFFAFDYDIDGDKNNDVIIIGFPGEAAHWYKNPGKDRARTGNWERFTILSSVDNESPTFTDLTGDGKPEIVCCNGGTFGYAEIPKDPTQPWTYVPVSENGKFQRFTHGLGVGDVNDDGRLDIMSKEGWWEQPSDRSVTPWKMHRFAFSGPGGAQMYAVDLDGDGKTEVVTSLAAHGYGLVAYKKKSPAGDDWDRIDIMTDKVETSPTGLVVSQLHAIDIADMDNDGKPDIVAGKRFWAHNGSDRGENEPPLLVWFKPVVSNSGLRFIPNIVDDNSGVGTQIVAKDINNDRRLDILSVSKRGVHVLKQVMSSAAKPEEPKLATALAKIKDDLGGFRPAWSETLPMNVDFETGDLRDWSQTGAAFFNQPMKGDVVAVRRKDMSSEHQGDYWVGSFEVTGDIAFGTLSSKPFRLQHPWVSFLQGGGSNSETRVEIVDFKTNEVIAKSVGHDAEAMKRAVLRLDRAVGSDIFIRLIDNNKDGWGHINFDDFRIHAEEPKIASAQRLPTLDKLTYKSLPPDKVADAMTLPEGFSVQVIASEPVVRQPVAMTIDHRGRVWIAEAYQYPLRADGDEGKDRVLILEDTNGDGTLDSHKIFADNLNLVSGIEVGFGGLWVGAAPYLLFIPDKDGNDVADGPAIKKLEGWGYQDTHETLNSFIWGPDGWLYGCHGVFTHSDVRVVKSSPEETKAGPVTKINAGIWRYHPQSESFEVFAHGTSNPWGVDFNDTGDAFLTACVIPHLYHIIPQARYQRQAGQHFNPFTYSDIQTIALHRHWIGDTPHSGNNRSDSAGGGHAHSGAMFYLGGSWPEKYRNQLFMNNIHGARINQDKIARRGSGYLGDRAPDFLLANDLSSQILYFRSGPDGQVIAIDWYDAQQCHVKDPSKHDQSNGRVYRISYNNAKPVQVDLSKASDLQLVEHQTSKNDWYVRTARRLLMERQHLGSLSTSALSELGKLLKHAEPRIRLRALWALAACSSLSQADIDLALDDKDEHVRGWGVRLLSQPATSFLKQHSPAAFMEVLASMAANEPSALVRCELAAASHRLPAAAAHKIVEQLVTHAEDNGDHNLPWMVWYAASRVIEETPKASIDLLGRSKIEKVSEYIARQVSQTYVAKPDERNSETFVSLLSKVASHPVPETAAKWMDSILVALESKRTLNAPTGWPQVSKELLLHPNASMRLRGAQLASKLNDKDALQLLRDLVAQSSAKDDDRIAALNILKQVKAEGVSPLAFGILSKPGMRSAALSAIADSLDVDGAKRVLDVAIQWPEIADRRLAWFAMLRRVPTAEVLLNALESKKLPSGDLTADMVQQIQRLNSEPLMNLVAQVWGNVRGLDEDKQKAVAKIRTLVEKESKDLDPMAGKVVFTKICGQCHVLFGEGGKIGPELTGSNRRDVNYLLENVLDPSAVMAKEYQPIIVRTKDEQTVTGLLKQSTPDSIRLQTATDEVVIYTSEIEERKQSKTSMMPSDLLTPLSDSEIQSLFAYLRSK